MGNKQNGPDRPDDSALGVHTEAPTARLRAQSARIAGAPVIVMVQPETVSWVSADGTPRARDSVETVMQASGARTFTLPPDFEAEAATGWQAHLSPSTSEMRISRPGGLAFYEGTMPTTPDWPRDVAAAGTAVLITGPMATLSDFEPLIAKGRVLWLRVPFEIKG
ncbi:hypothetical protein KVH27_35515 [Streptomyces olivaceus]|uniref:hypothetical protein n=1 Tax=Streptomyces olivaceus TaxID=47716 RepID=UPI001CCE5414|nr:hypothetical protein [Streptomyces olivaceus]MBZ6253660.1 hypothetical protein [Streptomyces olivaceus]